jgi:DNA-binding NarL/FixJ family response regulator
VKAPASAESRDGRIGILLVDDHRLVREGLRGLLNLDTGVLVVGEAADGRQAVAMSASLKPDVILMDIAMPRLNGLESARQILAADPRMRIIILSAYADPAYVASALSVGAGGFAVKHATSADLLQVIRRVFRREGFVDASRGVVEAMHGSRRPALHKPSARLSPREAEMLQLIAEGRGTKHAARMLGICVKTAEKHREHLMAKLGIHDIAGLTRYAISRGIVESSVEVDPRP